MTDKELIKQEIERLKNHTLDIQKSTNELITSVGRGRVEAFNDILKFIDSLPEEPTDEANCTTQNEGLEEEAEAFYDNCNTAKSSWWVEGILHKMSESKETFIAGAKWQKQQMMKDACNTKITTDGNSIFPIIKYRLPLTYDCKIGDKVKLIIIKEEQQ